MEVRGLTMIWPGAPQHIASEPLQALAFVGTCGSFGRLHRRFHPSLALSSPLLDASFGSRNDGLQVRRQIAPGLLRERMTPGLGRFW